MDVGGNCTKSTGFSIFGETRFFMSAASLNDIYSQRISRFQSAAGHHTRRMNWLSIVRLLSLLAIVWFIVLAVKQENPVFYACSGAMLMIFLFLVKRYNFQKDLRNLNIRIRDLNQKELSCLKHQFREYPDGREFADPRHPWSHDLDLFGRGSLYQYLNRTSTIKGRALLAEALTTEPGGPGSIAQRQGLITDLKERIDFRQTFTARGEMFEETGGDLPGIEKWLIHPGLHHKPQVAFLPGLISSTLSIFIIAYGLIVPGGARFLLPLLLFNFAMLSPFLARTNLYQHPSQKNMHSCRDMHSC